MKYLLDTNICVFHLQGKYDVPRLIEQAGCENCYISEITVGELLYGASCSSQKEKHVKLVEELISLFTVLPIFPVLPLFADMKALLRQQGKLIDDFDLLIGATAVRNDMILVTENVKHLARIPDIRIENWVKR